MQKILILCTGNSCRSQMAAAFIKHFNNQLLVHSAGTHPAPHVNPEAITYLEEIGINIREEQPKSVEHFLDESWDYVITVCGGANEKCPLFTGNVKHRLHLGFDDPSEAQGSPEFIASEFRRVRDEIRERFLKFMQQENLL